MFVCCNHASIEFICRSHVHQQSRWYGCLDCGSVFEVSEGKLMKPADAAKLLSHDDDYKNQHEVASFRHRHEKRPPPLPFCPGCDVPYAGLGGHECDRFKGKCQPSPRRTCLVAIQIGQTP